MVRACDWGVLVIAAQHVDVRLDAVEQIGGGIVAEDAGRVGVDHSGCGSYADLGGLDRAGWSLAASAIGIIVYRDNQPRARSFGCVEQVQVTQMQNVETAVDEHDPMVLLMPEPRQLDRFLGREDVQHGPIPDSIRRG